MNKGRKVGKYDHVQTIKYSSVVEVQENTKGKQHKLRPERQLIARLQIFWNAQLEVSISWVDQRKGQSFLSRVMSKAMVL